MTTSLERAIRMTVVTIVILGHRINACADIGTLADGIDIVAFGRNDLGQADPPSNTVPIKEIESGFQYAVALRADGTVIGWGVNSLPDQLVLPSGTFKDIDSSGDFSGIGVRLSGALEAWNVQAGLPPLPMGVFAAVAGSQSHGVALRLDGTLAAIGNAPTPPTGFFQAVESGGANHTLVAIRQNGTLATWGGPLTPAAPAGTFLKVSTNRNSSLGIRTDGTLIHWGADSAGVSAVPGGTYADVARGFIHALALRPDGSLVAWGSGNTHGETSVPTTGAFVQVAAGDYVSYALRARTKYDDLNIFGTGATANLNRSVEVANDLVVSTALNAYNNPVANVAGRLVLETGADLTSPTGAGATIVAHGIELRTNTLLSGVVSLVNGGPITGTGNLELLNTELDVYLDTANAYSGGLALNGSQLHLYGIGVQRAARLEMLAGSELRLSGGQRLVTGGLGFENSGRIEILAGGGAQSSLETTGAIFNFTGGELIGHNMVLRSAATLNFGSLTLTAGINDFFGSFVNGADVLVTGGATAVFYDDVSNDGTLQIKKQGATSSVAVFLGDYYGEGTISGGGDLFFEGNIAPGNSPAAVSFENNVEFGSSSRLFVELGGTVPGSEYDRVLVTGQLSLDGTLDVSLLPGFEPAAGQSFDILDWGSRSGTFASINLPTLSGLLWDTSQLYTTGVLSVAAPGLPGDYNADGTVDAADYVVWRKNPGAFGGDPAGYDTWRANFSATLGSNSSQSFALPPSSAIPEPTSALLLLYSAAMGAWRHRRGLHRQRIAAAKQAVNLRTLSGRRGAAFVTHVEPSNGT